MSTARTRSGATARRRRPGLGVVVGILVVAGAVWWGLPRLGTVDGTDTSSAPDTLVRPSSAAGPMPVERVVDGDTVIVLRDGAEERVRLLGIDTPESVKPDSPVECFGPEASARTAELLTGRSVWLEGDPTQESVDQYGRTLAYAWLDESTLVNQVLVAEGYAYEYTYGVPGVHQEALAAAQDEASAARLGLWGAC